MNALRVLASRLLGLFGKRRLDETMDAELRAHLELLTDENIRRGMNPEEALFKARREFGGVEQTKEVYRGQRGLPFLDALLQDLRFALRTLRRQAGFSLAVVLILALGIGATTAVFSVVDRILFRSLPYPEDDRLVSFGVKAPFENLEFMLAPEYGVLRKQSVPFEAMTSLATGGGDCDLTEENPVRVSCALVESTFLSTLGLHPALGRDFVPNDDLLNAPRVAILSHGLWRARYGSDPRVIGKILNVDDKPVEVIGVLPAVFEMPNLGTADMLLPEALDESALDRNNPRILLRAFARLQPGINIPQAAAALQPWFQESLRFVPPQFRAEVSLHVQSLRDRQMADSRVGAWILLGAVAALLLLSCSNVANLLLARAAGRKREFAVRTALGAGRMRLARQTLTESVLLGTIGGVAGVFVAYALLRMFVSIAPEGIQRLQQASLDARVLSVDLAVSIVCGILFGIVPAMKKPSPQSLNSRDSRGFSRLLFRQALVCSQMGASVILLAGAGLLLRTLWNIQRAPLGLDPQRVVIAHISLGEHRYPDTPRQWALFNQLWDRLKRVPGVTSLALSNSLPPAGGVQATFFASLEVSGRPRLAQGTGGMVDWRTITPGYFPALNIPILRGRGFTENDLAPTENPVVLSATLAAKLFPGQDPLGKTLRFNSFDTQGPWRTVVGIAADVKNDGLTASTSPEFYIPWKNEPEAHIQRSFVILRSSLNDATLVHWVRAEIANVDPTLPVEFTTMDQRVSKLAEGPRFDAVLLSLFAFMGVLLAAMGIYGLVGFLVAQQTREIGVRMALGASPQNILRMVLSTVARWTLGGAVVGILGAWFSARLLESLLFEVKTHDPVLLCGAVLLLLAAAFLAAWIPARRAMRVDPMVALRYE
jgi:putative ABC transport system permease protein